MEELGGGMGGSGREYQAWNSWVALGIGRIFSEFWGFVGEYCQGGTERRSERRQTWEKGKSSRLEWGTT